MSIHDIVKRRMAHTGETEEEATRAVFDAFAEIQKDSVGPEGWVEAWKKAEGQSALDDCGQWLRARPREVQDLARRFPPMCLVRAKEGFHFQIPALGQIGIVDGYSSPSSVVVRAHPQATFVAQCPANEIEVVGYCGAMTVEWVASVLDN